MQCELVTRGQVKTFLTPLTWGILNLTSLLLLSALSVSQAGTENVAVPSEVRFSEEWAGPHGSGRAMCSVYKRKGDVYSSTVKSVPVELVNKIVRIALDARNSTGIDLAEYGITKSSVIAHEAQMIQRAKQAANVKSIPSDLQYLFEYPFVCRMANEALTEEFKNPYETYNVVISGDEDIVISCRASLTTPILVPWTVSKGKDTWTCYSRQLPLLLSEMSSDSSRKRLNEDIGWGGRIAYASCNKKYWSCGFFANYDEFVVEKLESFSAIRAAKSLPGFEAAAKQFDLTDGYIVGEKKPYVCMSIKKDAVVDCVGWDLAGGWDNLLRRYNAVEQSVEAIPWLHEWKKHGPDRSVYVDFGSKEEWRTDSELKKIWDSEHNKGFPVMHVYLREKGCVYNDVFIAEPEEPVLITNMATYRKSSMIFNEDSYARIYRLPKSLKFNSAVLDFSNRTWKLIAPSGLQLASSGPQSVNAESSDCPWEYDDTPEPAQHWDSNDPLSVQDLEEAMPGVEFRKSGSISFGLVNRSGDVVLRPEYAQIDPFSEGRAAVETKNGKYGFVDIDGNLIVAPQFDRIERFTEGLAAVCKNGKWGFIDKDGSEKISCQYDLAHSFSQGLAAVRQKNFFGYIDHNGTFLIEPKFTRARMFHNGIARVQIDGKHGFIDQKGNLLGGTLYDEMQAFSEGLAACELNKRYGYIDCNGKIAIPFKFATAEPFKNGCARVDNGKGIDRTGNLMSEFKMKQPASDLRDGIVEIKKDGRYGFADLTGRVIVAPQYDSIGRPIDGLIVVGMEIGQCKYKYGVVDKTGAVIVPLKFDELGTWGYGTPFSENIIPASNGEKWGAIDLHGEYVIPPVYDRVFPCENGIAVVQNGLKYGYVSRSGKEVFRPQFDIADRFNKLGIARVGILNEPKASDPFKLIP